MSSQRSRKPRSEDTGPRAAHLSLSLSPACPLAACVGCAAQALGAGPGDMTGTGPLPSGVKLRCSGKDSSLCRVHTRCLYRVLTNSEAGTRGAGAGSGRRSFDSMRIRTGVLREQDLTETERQPLDEDGRGGSMLVGRACSSDSFSRRRPSAALTLRKTRDPECIRQTRVMTVFSRG